MGALLAFKKNYFEKALYLKHLFGGALRQSGIIAAAGIYALQKHINRLEEDHKNAEYLRDKLSETPAFEVEKHPLTTNMVFFKWHGKKMCPTLFHQTCLDKGVRFSQVDKNRFRAVLHLDIHTSQVKKVMQIVNEITVDNL